MSDYLSSKTTNAKEPFKNAVSFLPRLLFKLRKMPSKPKRVSLPPSALFSFLKETKGITSWTGRDFAKTLNLSTADAKEALAILEMQGYVKATGSKEWMTTPQGEIVSGSKFPRYSRESVEQSLASFTDHLKRVNQDSSAEYKIADAVAFGDFLSGRARVQVPILVFG